MTRQATILMLLAAVLVAGCASKGKEAVPKTAYGCPMGPSGGSSMRDLVRAKLKTAGDVPDVTVSQIRCRIQSDMLHVDATFANDSGKVRHVSYRFEWVDEAGYKAWDTEAWKPLQLNQHGDETIVAVAPTRKAADFRIVLMDQD